jgi:hypothetical protein
LGLWLPGNPASWSASVGDVKILIEVAGFQAYSQAWKNYAQIVYLVFISFHPEKPRADNWSLKTPFSKGDNLEEFPDGHIVRKLQLKEAFGHHEGAFVKCLAQIGNDHSQAAGGMNHLAAPQVNSHMADMATPVAKKEEISGQHFGEIQGFGHYRTYPGLLAAGARQVNIGFFVDKLHKPRAIGGMAGL